MDIRNAKDIASSGMRVQAKRLEVIAENIANVDSVSTEPGGDPYRRKVIFFKNALDAEKGIYKVQVKRIERDKNDFKLEYNPGHPAADEKGYVKKPNVESLIESEDAKEAQRAYEANLKMFQLSESLMKETLDRLK